MQGLNTIMMHVLLWKVYGESPHCINGTHLTGGVLDNALWKSCWKNLAVKSANWYSTPPIKMGHGFTAVLTEEWQEVLDWKWNSEATFFL